MSEISKRARKATPLSIADFPELLRTTAINLRATNRNTGHTYDDNTDVSTLVTVT